MFDGEISEASESALWAALQDAVGGEKAHILMELAGRSQRDGELSAAASLFEQAQQEFAALGDDHGQAAALSDLGSVLHGAGSYPEAAEAHGASAELRVSMGDLSDAAWELWARADSLYFANDYESCLESADSALALAIGESQPNLAGEACLMKARALYYLDREDEALHTCEQAREHYRQCQKYPTERVVILDDFALGVALYLGRLDDALRFARSAWALSNSTSDQRGVAHAAFRLATTHQRREEFRDAISLAADAAERYRAADDLRGLALCQKVEADALFELHEDLERCRTLYVNAKVLLENLGMVNEAFYCGEGISWLLNAAGRQAEAAVNERQLLNMAMEPEIPMDAARWSADRLAWFELMSGQPEAALTTTDQCLGLWDDAQSDDPSLRSILATRARALHDLGRQQEAADLAAEVLAATPPGRYTADTAYMSEYRAEALRLAQPMEYPYHLAQAVALHLAHGNVDRARQLSHYFIDDDKELMRAPRSAGAAAKRSGRADASDSPHDAVDSH